MVINTPRFHYGHYEHIGYISALLCFLKITQTTAVHNMNFANIKDDNVSSIWASLKVLSNLNCITLIWHYALLTRTHVLFAIHNFIFCPELRNVNFLAIFCPFQPLFAIFGHYFVTLKKIYPWSPKFLRRHISHIPDISQL